MIEFDKFVKYNELCEMFGELPKKDGGRSRKCQMKKFLNSYEIIKSGTKYKVVRELSQQEKAEMVTYGKNRKYIEPMLYTLLVNESTNILRFGMRELMISMNLVNADYHFAKYNPSKVDIFLTGKDSSGVSTFVRETEPMYRRILKDILYDMEDRKLIYLRPVTVFAEVFIDGETGRQYTRTHDASEDIEIPKLLEAQREVLKNYNIERWSQLNYYQQMDAKKDIAKILNISYYYHEYNISLNKDGIKEEMVLNNYKDMQKSFNHYIQDKTFNSKTKGMNLLTDEEKALYIDALIDTSKDLGLRNKI